MENLEFLNVVRYVEEQKQFIELLYAKQKIVMSPAARNDLARISPEEITSNFSIEALAQWQKGNILLKIKSYFDYVSTDVFITIDGAHADSSSMKNEFNKQELQLVTAALSHWDSFCNLFYDRIENVDTLKILLRSGEKQRTILLGRETSLEKNDIVAHFSEKTKRLCDYLRERIKTLETISPVISGDVIEQSLTTTLTLEEFRKIVHQLVDARYVAAEFKTNSALTEQWYYYALNNGKHITARKCKLKWISTTISLAQFVMILVDAEAIHYKEYENAALYRWLHRCFQYEGSPSTLEADIRRALTVKVQCFSVKQRKGQPLQFIVEQIGRPPRAK